MSSKDRARTYAALATGVLVAVAAGVFAARAEAAPWCGTVSPTDRPPVVAGPPIHILYVIPSDGVDASGEWAPRIADDIDEIESWWLAHDGSHVPRFDRASFACGAQADVRIVRLPLAVGEITSVTNAGWVFDRVADVVEGAKEFSRDTKYLAYLDLRMSNDTVCGVGSGAFENAGLATVFLHNCEDVKTATVAVHELLHAMGGNPSGPTAHACPGDDAHVCDSTGDVLAPYAEYARLPALGLDVGNDDYYAHGGAGIDLQDSRWLHEPANDVAVTVRVDGAGRVVNPEGYLDCSAACTVAWARGSRIGFVPVADAGSRFFHWAGACQGGGSGCAVDLAGPVSIEAVFGPETFQLTLQAVGRGKLVAAAKPAFPCSGTCVRAVPSLARVKLSAAPSRGWRFVRWSGACTGARPTCVVPMTAKTAVRAVFAKRP